MEKKEPISFEEQLKIDCPMLFNDLRGKYESTEPYDPDFWGGPGGDGSRPPDVERRRKEAEKRKQDKAKQNPIVKMWQKKND